VSVCLSVCLSVRSYISKTTVQISRIFLWMLTACGRGSVLLRQRSPILWMTSCFHKMELMGQNERRRVRFVEFARWQHQGRIYCLLLQSCCFICILVYREYWLAIHFHEIQCWYLTIHSKLCQQHSHSDVSRQKGGQLTAARGYISRPLSVRETFGLWRLSDHRVARNARYRTTRTVEASWVASQYAVRWTENSRTASDYRNQNMPTISLISSTLVPVFYHGGDRMGRVTRCPPKILVWWSTKQLV